MIGSNAIIMVMFFAVLAADMIITSYITGMAFDWGNQLLFQGVPIAENSIALTLKPAFAFILPSTGFGLLAIFIALVTENTGITIGTALALYMISPLLEKYGSASSYSIIHLMNNFHEIFLNRTPLQEISSMLGVIAAYALLFYIGSALFIKRKDVLL